MDPRLIPCLPELAPGVVGGFEDEPDVYRLLFVLAVRERSGDVGRYLDSLPRDREVVVATVVSERLAGMLERRGFVRRDYDWIRLPS